MNACTHDIRGCVKTMPFLAVVFGVLRSMIVIQVFSDEDKVLAKVGDKTVKRSAIVVSELRNN